MPYSIINFQNLYIQVFQSLSLSSFREWGDLMIEDVCATLSEELSSMGDMNKSVYKRTLALSMIFKFLNTISLSEVSNGSLRTFSPKTVLDGCSLCNQQ